jgi:hypothetical protein
MLARAEVLGDGTIGREELLGVSRRIKPLAVPRMAVHHPGGSTASTISIHPLTRRTCGKD